MADLNNTIVRGKLRVTEDINTNGSITGNGSGLTSLNASNIGSGTLNVDRLADSGVTAGAYGDTTAQTPGYNATFKVPSISVNAKGIVTAIGEHTVTIPASDNTWRGIQDNLTSDSTTDSLSAKQGKELKKLVDGKSDSGHTHNYAGSSSAGGIANSAKELGTLFYKASEAAGAEGYYKIATITHKTWSYCSFTMFTTNSYSGAKFNTLFDVRCSDNAESLNGFAFNIIGGTDISNKLKYLETKSGNNITKIEIFMQCSRYEHPKFYLVTSSISNGLALNTIDWGDTPDKASSTAMTGSAANTIKAAALTVSAGSATKPIYFNNGIPTECNYALEKAVPSDAIFTDTKNTAGSTDSTEKLYLIGAGEQTDNPKTYSKSSLYVDEIGILTTSTLKTGTIKVNNLDLSIYGYNHDIATFKSYTNGETEEVLNGHLVIYGDDDSSNPLKPADKSGITYLDTYYFNTGITLDSGGDAEGLPKLSFPGKSGTFLLDSDLVAEDMVEAVFSPSDKTYNSVPSGSLADSSNSILTVSSSGIEMSLNAGDRVTIKAFTGALGDNNTPICITNGGHLCPCTKYAGGTRVTLNGGTPSSGSDVSFYAPTAKGTSGYHLFWNGESTISPTANTYKNYTTTSSTKYYIAGWDSGTSTTSGNTPLKQMGQSIYMIGGSTGNLYASAFYAASDRRLKENIKDLDLNCLDLVNNINLREFSWKADEEHKPVIGAIAQELRQVLPEKYVHEFIGGQETEDEYLSINDSKLVYLLIGAIQEQQKEIESLKAKIDSKIV